MRPSPYRCIRRVCQRPALHFVTSKEARSGTISTSDANDPMAIISMLFLFVKQSAFICRMFIKNGSGKGRNGCTKFLPRLSSYSPRHSPHAESGNVLLSQVFPHVLDPPLAAHMGEPNQVHSLTSSETTREMDVTDAQSFFRAFPPTLPGVPPCAGSATGGAHGGT